MNRNQKIVYAIVLICGLVFTLVSVIIFASTIKFKSNGIKTDATITKIERNYSGDDENFDVYVEFFVDGEKYQGRLNAYEIGFAEGNKVPILYLKDNPGEFIYAKHNFLIATIFLIVGLALLAVTVGLSINHLITKIKIKKLKQTGKKVIATVKQVQDNSKIRFAGSVMKLVSCIGENGKLYEKKILCPINGGIKQGDKLIVYVSYDDADNFVIDVDSVNMGNRATDEVFGKI